MTSASYRTNNSYSNGRSSSDTQDSHPRGTQHPQAVTMNSPRPTLPTSFIKEPTNTIGRNCKARSSSDSWRKTSHTLTTRKKSPDEVCLLPPALYLAPPAFLESPQDKEERQRQQKLIDESRRKR